MSAQATPATSGKETPKGAWTITFLLFLFMLVNFADKIVVGLAGCYPRGKRQCNRAFLDGL